MTVRELIERLQQVADEHDRGAELPVRVTDGRRWEEFGVRVGHEAGADLVMIDTTAADD